ncbi:Thioesterase superfamily protein [Burkholderiales bacterium]|nr:Thioesterase superfamily protein [Burkholderiales bacterium]
MDHAPFEHRLRVRYHETDQQGIVYHARYLEYLDVAMTEYLRHLGWDYKSLLAEGCDPSLVRTTLQFLRPAGQDDEISVAVWPSQVGNSSFTLCFRVKASSDGEALLSAEIVYVNFDATNRRSRSLPSAVRDRIRLDIPVSPADAQWTAPDRS